MINVIGLVRRPNYKPWNLYELDSFDLQLNNWNTGSDSVGIFTRNSFTDYVLLSFISGDSQHLLIDTYYNPLTSH